MAMDFYSNITNLQKINSVLSDENFFKERGYSDISEVPNDIKNLAFPVYAPFCILEKKFFRDKLLLDIGCGAGLDMFFMTRLKARCVGFDFSYPLLVLAKNVGVKNIVNADATHIPFKENVFDGIIINGVFNLIDDKKMFLENCIKLMRKDAILFVADIYLKCKDIYIPDEGVDLNLKGALMMQDLLDIFKSLNFELYKEHIEEDYTKEFGIFAFVWIKR